MIESSDIEYVSRIAIQCEHNRTLARDIEIALALGRVWMSAPAAIREASFKDLEAAMAVNAAWEGSAVLRGTSPDLLAAAGSLADRWQRSSLRSRSTPRDIGNAALLMDAWNRLPHCKGCAPKDLLDAHEAFKGKSPSEPARGDTREKACKQSPALRNKPKQQLDRIMALYAYWHANKHAFNNASPADLAKAETLVRDWKKEFASTGADQLIQAEALVAEWKSRPARKGACPGKGVEQASGPQAEHGEGGRSGIAKDTCDCPRARGIPVF